MRISQTLLLALTICCLLSCNRIKEKTKATINKGGEVVGETASEFFEGVGAGVEKTLDTKVVLSDELLDKGVSTGKTMISANAAGGFDNVLSQYLIFEKPLQDTLYAKIYDKNGTETGRAKVVVEAEAEDAGYYDFSFDTRTRIESKSKIVIE